MKRLMLAAVAAIALEVYAEEPAEKLEEETPTWIEAGVDVDFLSAYVYRNSIINDDMVMQPCVWIDFVRLEPFWLGASVWQNWNLTTRQRDDGVPTEMNETDFNVHAGGVLWSTDDEGYSVELEIGHEWFTYRYDYPNSNEFYARLEFKNPFIGVYGRYSHAYWPENGCHFEVGLAQEWNMADVFESECDYLRRLTAGIDWNINFGSGKFLSNYVYGMLPDGEDGEKYMSNGVGGTTLQGTIAYQVCDNLSLGVTLAYTALLSEESRDVMDYYEYDDTHKQLVWGGIQVRLSF